VVWNLGVTVISSNKAISPPSSSHRPINSYPGAEGLLRQLTHVHSQGGVRGILRVPYSLLQSYFLLPIFQPLPADKVAHIVPFCVVLSSGAIAVGDVTEPMLSVQNE
jgi:hypothetical protein